MKNIYVKSLIAGVVSGVYIEVLSLLACITVLGDILGNFLIYFFPLLCMMFNVWFFISDKFSDFWKKSVIKLLSETVTFLIFEALMITKLFSELMGDFDISLGDGFFVVCVLISVMICLFIGWIIALFINLINRNKNKII